MRVRTTIFACWTVATLVTVGRRAHAQIADAGVAEAGPPPSLIAPVLKSSVQATYPQEALRSRREGNVGLELDVDETGKVLTVRVTSPAGDGLDEAAVDAAKKFAFEPARKNDVAIAATVQFTYAFRLPAEPTSVPTAPVPASTPQKETIQEGIDQSTLVLARRPISAASAFSVRDRDFQLRPIGSVQDILRVTPGLVVVQHAGGGKANQYFMRGFDADHGTDLALSIDGVPINMVSHAHGQGFSDTNFIIPEVVERVEITKGPYFTGHGDFATAGAVNMISRENFEQSSIGFGVGTSPGHGLPGYRGLFIASPKLEGAKATFAAEVGRQNGPFDTPENFDRYKLYNRVTLAPSPTSSLTFGEMSYGGNWRGSGQIPARAVEQGLVSRFGSIDPDEGGNTGRHQLFAQYKAHPSQQSEFRALTYVGTYRFNLFSNFTLYLNDPINGDEIEQVDRRVFYGGKLSYRVLRKWAGVSFDTTLGADARSDDIHGELWSTVRRAPLNQMRSHDVRQTMLGASLNEEISPVPWIRLNLGGRADLLSFAVDDKIANPSGPASGVGAAHQLSPKASLIVTPILTRDLQLDLYGNYGHGFHSNDVRGAFATPAVTPLTRAIGEEVGARGRFFERWDLAAALWKLDLDSETVWSGDEGTTSVGGSTSRQGVEVETRFELAPWLAADLDVTFTKSAFREDPGGAGGLALAPKQTWSGGLSARHDLGPGPARGGLRFFGIGDRPASDDGALVAQGFTQLDLHLGYRHKRFDLALDVENLLNGRFRSAQFATTSRLQNDPAVGAAVPPGFSCGTNGRLATGGGPFSGCEDVSYTPAYPRTVRVMGTVFLD